MGGRVLGSVLCGRGFSGGVGGVGGVVSGWCAGGWCGFGVVGGSLSV